MYAAYAQPLSHPRNTRHSLSMIILGCQCAESAQQSFLPHKTPDCRLMIRNVHLVSKFWSTYVLPHRALSRKTFVIRTKKQSSSSPYQQTISGNIFEHAYEFAQLIVWESFLRFSSIPCRGSPIPSQRPHVPHPSTFQLFPVVYFLRLLKCVWGPSL